MSKKRKTKKEKILAYERKKYLITQSSTIEAVYSFNELSFDKISKTSSIPYELDTKYAYVLKDIRKSVFTTITLVFMGLLLFTLLRLNILKLSFLGY